MPFDDPFAFFSGSGPSERRTPSKFAIAAGLVCGIAATAILIWQAKTYQPIPIVADVAAGFCVAGALIYNSLRPKFNTQSVKLHTRMGYREKPSRATLTTAVTIGASVAGLTFYNLLPDYLTATFGSLIMGGAAVEVTLRARDLVNHMRVLSNPLRHLRPPNGYEP